MGRRLFARISRTSSHLTRALEANSISIRPLLAARTFLIPEFPQASFLLGGAGSFERGQFVIWPDERATRISGYGGDSWKATPKLTLNYGLRWDYISPISPKNPGGDVNYDFNNGSLILAGLGRVSKYSNVQPRYNNFAPRLGFAYMLTEKTVIRGGLGRSYFINGFDAAFNHLDSSYPVAQAQAVEQSSLYTPIFPMNEGPPTPQAPVFPSSGIIPAAQVPANDFAKAWYSRTKDVKCRLMELIDSTATRERTRH